MQCELRSEIRRAIETYCDELDLSQSMLDALSRPDFALHPETRCTAGLLTLKIYESICGEITAAALHSAAAVELYMEAACIFDNIADGDIDLTQSFTPAEELTIAIGLLMCGGIAACEAGRQAGGDAKGLSLLLRLQQGCLNSCSGQLQDIRLQKQKLISTDEALEMTCRKSGNIGKQIATIGALIATDSSEVVDLFSELGFNLFTYLQLIDDLRDACPSDVYPRDIEQHKKTLPLAYFYKSLLQEHSRPEYDIIPSLNNEQAQRDIRYKFRTSGAGIFCAIVAETFMNRAKSNLVSLEGRVRTVEGLAQFVSSLEISPDEVPAAA